MQPMSGLECVIVDDCHTEEAGSVTVRLHTKFQTCERHRWLDGELRYRRAEFFVEGGPANQAGCRGGRCRLWPGRDLFVAEICESEFRLDWTEPDPEYADVDEAGQLSIGVAGEQRAIPGLAQRREHPTFDMGA